MNGNTAIVLLGSLPFVSPFLFSSSSPALLHLSSLVWIESLLLSPLPPYASNTNTFTEKTLINSWLQNFELIEILLLII